jgi:hypothetical protein
MCLIELPIPRSREEVYYYTWNPERMGYTISKNILSSVVEAGREFINDA